MGKTYKANQDQRFDSKQAKADKKAQGQKEKQFLRGMM